MLWSSSPTAVNIAALADQQLHQLVLHGVGVLVLVDQHVAQPSCHLARHLGVALRAACAAGRSGRRSRPPGRRRGAPRSASSRARRHVLARRRSAPAASACSLFRPWFFQRLMAHCQRRASALSVVPPASFRTPSTSSLSRMLKLGFRPSALAVAAQHAHAERMEGADRQRLGGARADQRLGALAHFGRGLVGEGDRRDLPRRVAGLRAGARSCG